MRPASTAVDVSEQTGAFYNNAHFYRDRGSAANAAQYTLVDRPPCRYRHVDQPTQPAAGMRPHVIRGMCDVNKKESKGTRRTQWKAFASVSRAPRPVSSIQVPALQSRVARLKSGTRRLQQKPQCRIRMNCRRLQFVHTVLTD